MSDRVKATGQVRDNKLEELQRSAQGARRVDDRLDPNPDPQWHGSTSGKRDRSPTLSDAAIPELASLKRVSEFPVSSHSLPTNFTGS